MGKCRTEAEEVVIEGRIIPHRDGRSGGSGGRKMRYRRDAKKKTIANDKV